MKKFDIVAIGSATKDTFIKSDFSLIKSDLSVTGQFECLPFGSKIDISDFTLSSGGGGANSAVTFSRQGFSTACISALGSDDSGLAIINELKEEGVDTQYINIHEKGVTAFSIILLDKSGERTILNYKGEGLHIGSHLTELDFYTNWFYINSLGGNIDFLEKIIEYKHKNNTKIAFNPGGLEIAMGINKISNLLSFMDIFITNEEEAIKLLGGDIKDAETALNELAKIIKGILIITRGQKGVIVSGNGNIYEAGIPDSPRIDATGAGDAFGSGFVAEYMRSSDIKHSIEFATANASSVVAQLGAKAGILRRGEVFASSQVTTR